MEIAGNCMAWMLFFDLDLLGQSEKSPTNFLPNGGNFHADESQLASNPFKKTHLKHSEVEMESGWNGWNYHWDQLNLGKKALMALGFWLQVESGLYPLSRFVSKPCGSRKMSSRDQLVRCFKRPGESIQKVPWIRHGISDIWGFPKMVVPPKHPKIIIFSKFLVGTPMVVG